MWLLNYTSFRSLLVRNSKTTYVHSPRMNTLKWVVELWRSMTLEITFSNIDVSFMLIQIETNIYTKYRIPRVLSSKLPFSHDCLYALRAYSSQCNVYVDHYDLFPEHKVHVLVMQNQTQPFLLENIKLHFRFNFMTQIAFFISRSLKPLHSQS